jgi:hypothetical protein
MISLSLSVDDAVLDVIATQIERTPSLMQTAMARRIRSSSTRTLRKLREVPGRLPTLPFIWSRNPAAQARARRYYFAVIVGKGKRGGRYVRTGKLSRAWKSTIAVSVTEGLYTLANRAPGAQFVYGDRQVPSHSLTGWVHAPTIIQEEQVRMRQDLIETWITISDPRAGVRP